jgi:hypothetical protein
MMKKSGKSKEKGDQSVKPEQAIMPTPWSGEEKEWKNSTLSVLWDGKLFFLGLGSLPSIHSYHSNVIADFELRSAPHPFLSFQCNVITFLLWNQLQLVSWATLIFRVIFTVSNTLHWLLCSINYDQLWIVTI